MKQYVNKIVLLCIIFNMILPLPLLKSSQKRTVNQTLFTCPLCNLQYRRRSYLYASHMKKEHANTSHPCAFCSWRLPNKDTLNMHIFTRHGDKFFACLNCRSKFLSRSDLTQHKRFCTRRQNTFQEKQPEQDPNASTVSQWVTTFSKQSFAICPNCIHTFDNQEELTEHQRSCDEVARWLTNFLRNEKY